MNKLRLEAFSDGVFAIVITLLILDIKIPDVPPQILSAALIRLLPQLLTYFMSFFIVGLYWHLHHQVSAAVKYIDEPFIWLNLLWLLFVSILPFPTSLLGRYPLLPVPLTIYGINLILVNITGFVILAYLQRHNELRLSPMSRAQLYALAPFYATVNGLNAFAIALAWFIPWLSYMLYFIVLTWLIMSTFRRMNSGLGEA